MQNYKAPIFDFINLFCLRHWTFIHLLQLMQLIIVYKKTSNLYFFFFFCNIYARLKHLSLILFIYFIQITGMLELVQLKNVINIMTHTHTYLYYIYA